MSLLLLILIPFAIAGGCFVIRAEKPLVAGMAALALLVVAGVALATPVDEPARVGGVTTMLTPAGQIGIVSLLVVAIGAIVVSVEVTQGDSFAPACLVSLGFASAATVLQDDFGSVLCLLLAAVTLASAQLDNGAGEMGERVAGLRAALKYILIVTLGAVLLFAGFGSLITGNVALGFGLLVAGLGLWLPLVPLHLALPDLAEACSLPIFAIAAGVVQLGAVYLLMRVAEFHVPLAQAGSALTPLLVLAGITIFAVALLAFGSMRRMIAMLAIASVGEIVFAVALGTWAGPRGALAGMPAHALGLALVSAGGALWERQGVGEQGSQPLAKPMLVLGLLTFIGVPPFAGWPAKALLFDAAAQHGVGALVAVVGGHLLLVVAAVRLGRKMLDPSPVRGGSIVSPPRAGEGLGEGSSAPSMMIRITAAMLMLLSIALGVYPRPMLERADRGARAFPMPSGTADQP